MNPKEGNQRTSGGGREGKLLALAEKERQELGKEQLNPPKTAAEGNINQLQGVTGRRPCYCSTTRRCSRIKGKKRW